MDKRTGMTLGTTLLLVLIVSALAFSLASTSITHLRLSSERSNGMQAEELASSVVALGLESVLRDVSYGTRGNRGKIVEIKRDIDGVGLLSFDEDEAARAGIGYSSNNVLGGTSLSGWNAAVVPSAGLRLIGVGRYRGVQRRVEATYHVAAFPYCLASSGNIQALGRLFVAGLPPGADPQQFLASGKPGTVTEVVANSQSDQSIVVGPQSQITGNLRACGNIQLPGDALVQGSLLPHSRPARLPHIDLYRYDPLNLGRSFTNVTTISSGDTLSGLHRYEGGSLHVLGDLQLNGGLLFVKGDLDVSGGLLGKGAVVVTGSTRVGAASHFQSDQGVALYSGGPLRMSGNGDGSFFQGWLYAGKGLTAAKLTLVGTLICAGGEADGVTLDHCSVLATPDLVPVEIPLGPGAPPPRTVSLRGQWTDYEYQQQNVMSGLGGFGFGDGMFYGSIPGAAPHAGDVVVTYALSPDGAHVNGTINEPFVSLPGLFDQYGFQQGYQRVPTTTVSSFVSNVSRQIYDGYPYGPTPGLTVPITGWTSQMLDLSGGLGDMFGSMFGGLFGMGSSTPPPDRYLDHDPYKGKSNGGSTTNPAAGIDALQKDLQADMRTFMNTAPADGNWVMIMSPSEFLKIEDRIQIRQWRVF